MAVILKQVILLFGFILAGYIFGKSGLIDNKNTKILSTLGVYLFLPCTVIKSFSQSFTTQYISQYYPSMLLSVVVLLCVVAFAGISSKIITKENYERKVFNYSLVVPNSGYMGYALAEALYGAPGLLNAILLCFPISIYTYTVGFCTLTKRPLSLKKLINPMIIAMIIGAFFGISAIPIPDFIFSFIDKSSNCMAPVSMLLAGLAISEFKLRDLISDRKSYIVTALRLLVIPLAVFFILRPFCSETTVRTLVLLYSMPCGLNTIVFPKLIGEDCKMGARLAFLSNLFAIVTIPIVLGLT